jgi:glyoxylase-like metal-dependent hydrolase (beta-lactamase superfamily II)
MPKKSEQLPAEDTIVEVAPNILRLQLPANFTGLGHVNMYTMIDDRGIAVVDPGLPGKKHWPAIPARLKAAGFKIADIHTIVVTHSHPDHFGGAGRLAIEAGAEIVTHAVFRMPWDDSPDIVTLENTDPDSEDPPDDDGPGRHDPHGHGHDGHRGHGSTGAAATPVRWGKPGTRWGKTAPWGGTGFRPSFKHRMVMRSQRYFQQRYFVPTVPTQRMIDGEVIRLAGREFFAIHTPGHTDDHLCLFDPEAGVMISGDHVLPGITPHISGIGAASDPLDEFVQSLDRVATHKDAVKIVLPAHGVPFTDLAGRVDAIKAHHVERLEKVLEISTGLGRPGTVEEFTQGLFSPRHWGNMAESETWAHLEHLRHQGRAECHSRDGLLVYSVRPGDELEG